MGITGMSALGRGGWAVLLLLGSVVAALSQTAAPPLDPMRACGLLPQQDLLARSYNYERPQGSSDYPQIASVVARSLDEHSAKGQVAAEDLARQPDTKQMPSGGTVLITLIKPSGISDKDWGTAAVYGAAQTERRVGETKAQVPVSQVAVGMSLRERTANAIVVSALVPDNLRRFRDEIWMLVPVICGGEQNKVLGYGSVKLNAVSIGFAWLVSWALVLVVWLGATVASYQIYGTKLETLWPTSLFRTKPKLKPLWKWLIAANPIFISQDSLGFGSFARFQLLFFTAVVGFVLCFIFVHSGVLSALSNTILALLGVTAVGSTLGRVAGDWSGISPVSRGWLVGRGILVQRDKPRWSDLLESQGELDVAKIQALLFSTLIAASILASGYSGLAAFALPEQVFWLSLVSQGTYVFGKLLPTDTRKNLEEDLKGLFAAATAARTAPADPQAQQAYLNAVSTARITLYQTYGDRFEASKFDAATADPAAILGGMIPPDPAPPAAPPVPSP